MPPKRWVISPSPPADLIADLCRNLDILPLTALILNGRGYGETEAARRFLQPEAGRLQEHRLLPGVVEAGRLLAGAIQAKSLVAVCGDYDVDGLTAAALVSEFIADHGGASRVFLPDRFSDGYGLNTRQVQACRDCGAGLLVTVDCGITAVAETALARRLGLKVLVTDHHEAGLALPEADAIVDPKVSGPAEFKSLAGVGVALQVIRAAADELGGSDHKHLRKYLDLVALGTVADVVPLTGENRLLARSGLAVINQGRRPGLKALIQAAGLQPGALTAADVAFRLAPRINAAGRLGDARRSFELLTTQDPEEAGKIAGILNEENSRRQHLEQNVIREALAQINVQDLPPAIVAAGAGWPLGVLGLAASKICEKFHRPCFAISEHSDWARGSGRSIAGFPLHEVLAGLAPLLEKWGGHELAAGVTLPPDRIGEFRERLQAEAARRLQAEHFVAEIAIEALAPLDAVNLRLIRELQRLEPCGFGNPRPLLAVPEVRLAAPARVVGERHLKLKITDGRRHFLDVIGFGQAERADEIASCEWLDLAGYASENVWNGAVTVQMEMKDFCPAAKPGEGRHHV